MVWFISAAVGLLLFPIVAVSYVAWISVKPRRSPTPPLGDPGPHRLEEISFPSAGKTLRGWWVTPAGANKGLVLLIHGWGSHAEDMLGWSRFLADAGWSSVAFSYRGHGKSDFEGVMSMPRIADDVEAAVDFIRNDESSRGRPFFVLGHSMGGAAAILALSRGLRVDRAVISSTFARLETLTDYVLRRWMIPPGLFRWLVRAVWAFRLQIELEPLEPENTIRQVTVPLLLTHGERDPVIPSEEVLRLAESAPRAEVLEIPRAAHSDLLGYSQYVQGVLGFLEGAAREEIA